MQNTRLKIATPLMCILLIASTVPTVSAIEYLPGVTVGQWVKYKYNLSLSGNFTGLNLTELNPIPIDWMQMEVIAVSGTEVTIRSSMRFLNGTIPTNSTSVYNVAYGLSNGTCSSFGFIIASNLKEGDEINLPRCGNPLKINKTETRTYLGINRTVNILNISMPTISFSMGNITMEYNMKMANIYDKLSGMTFEMVVENNMTKPTPMYMKISITVADTNIFSTQTSTTTTTTSTTTSTTTTTQTTSSPTTTYTSTSTPTSTTTSPSTTSSITTTSTQTSTQQPSQGIPIEWIAVAVMIVFAVIVATLLIRRRR